MKVLVTGANGLLGHHVVMELLARNHSVSIIVRSTRNIYFDLALVDVFEGDFTNYENLLKAAASCEAIIHSAAVTATNLRHYEDYRKVNVAGAEQVIRVADELNINNIVYVSSANTVGFGTEQQHGEECFPIQFPFTDSFYAQSKAACENLMIQASKLPNRHVVTINPTFMIGKYDSKPSSGKLMLMGYKRLVIMVPKGGKNFVAVRDVSVAVCNALTLGKNGERYLVSGANLSFKAFYLLQKEIGIYKQCLIEIPDFLLIFLGKLGDLMRGVGIKTDLCSMNVRQLIIREYYKNTKAKVDLHQPETEIKVAIKEAIEWFKENGMIRS